MAEVAVQELRAKRGVIKSKLTRFANYVKGFPSVEQSSSEIINNLRLRVEKLEPLWDDFNEIQSNIDILEQSEQNEQEREQFESDYFIVISKAKTIIQDFERSQIAAEMAVEDASGFNSDHNSGYRENRISNNSQVSKIKLPPIKLPTFDGQYCNWLEFKELFVALVDQDESLSPLQKLYYLKSSLSESVKEKIKSIEVSGQNYSVVWEILLDRYENKKIIVHNHIHAIFELPSLSKESHIELRSLFDNANKHLRALKGLGENTDCWDRLIIYILTNKFDSVTRRGWESFECEGKLPELKDLEKFLKQRCEILEKLEITRVTETNKKDHFKMKYKRSSNSLASTEENKKYSCYYCKKDHSIFKCEEFLKLNTKERIAEVKGLKLCLNCLRPTHPSWKCKLSKCLVCNKAHNTCLHLETFENRERQQSKSTAGGTGSSDQVALGQVSGQTDSRVSGEPPTKTSVALNSQINQNNAGFLHSQVILSTAVIKIKTNNNKWITCRALLDSASQSNFITENLCNKLGLPKIKVIHAVKGIGQNLTNVKNQVEVSIMSCYNNNFSMNLRCLILPKITEKLPSSSFKKSLLNLPVNYELADEKFNIASDIDILLGGNVFWEILCSGQHRLEDTGLILHNTQFGWVVAGSVPIVNQWQSVNYCAINSPLEVSDNILNKFWELENVPNNNYNKQITFSAEEKYCEKYFEETTIRNESGRFIVHIPFKETLKYLGNSYNTALHRFELLEKRLIRDPSLKDEYCKFIAEYESLGHMSEITINDKVDYLTGYFVPHHAVFKADSITTKCRVVFDSSAKTNTGISLNDVQYTGPTLQQDGFSILARFRTYKYAMTADISKMYRQIVVTNEHRKYQRILWRAEPTQQLKIYEINRLIYGNASSPYLAVKCMFHLADENETNFPQACEIIRRDFYMDDLLTGANTKEELLKIQHDVSNILASAGLNLRKWLCNNINLLNKFQIDNELQASVLNIGEGQQNKTLGVYWDSHRDFIQYKVNAKNISYNKLTKRLILSVTCQIFDPLGLLCPILINAKLIMQDLWKLKSGWDDEVPPEIENKWKQFETNLSDIMYLKIPRQVVASDYIFIEIHGFSDASEKAFGAVIFIRVKTQAGKFISHLLCAKSRVAPIKTVSIPRLELCGAVLLANLMNKVNSILNLNFSKSYCWTDSMIALAWIKGSPSRWKPFVANRVGEIQSLTDTASWHHVKSEDNPADLISRGVSTSALTDCKLWWHGPSYLEDDSNKWDVESLNMNENIIPEQKSVSCVQIKIPDDVLNQLINRYSSLIKLQRIFAYIKRFIYNIKNNKYGQRLIGPLTPKEMDESLNSLIMYVQLKNFPKDYANLSNKKLLNNKSKLLTLNPFLSDGLLRVGGRLTNSQRTFDQKHPIIIPTNNVLTNLILRHEHERLLHCGVQTLLCSIRDKYWPINGRNSCKKIINNCITCFKAKPRESTYLMGNLPDVRVNSYAVFSNVGVDYGGPFLIKDRKTRGAKLIKSYVCLFVCMCTRAVHIELVSELNTEAFLAALNRFTSRRGKPSSIWSDNGGNFIGANNELSKISEFLENNNHNIANYLAKDKINWKFIPARSPNFGGIWEAGIKSTKYHIKRLVTHPLTYEDFSTLLTQIEGILNSRPLCPLSQDPDDLSALTPAHFLIGRPITSIPEINLLEVPENRLSKWQRVQALAQHYWTRWSKEYLNELQTRVKWKTNVSNLIKPGTLVLVKNDAAPSRIWQLGRVCGLRPGRDGVLRVVKIKVASGEITRAVNQICVLPLESE